MGNKPKYEYIVHTWGGFYNDQYKRIHHFEPGYKWFDNEFERDQYVSVLKSYEEKLNARHLMVVLDEGYHTHIKTILHRVVKYKGEFIYSEYDMGYAYPMDAAEYHMEYKWTPGFNDYAAIEDSDDEEQLKQVEIISEWITGAKLVSNGNSRDV